jgi:hypothetical protein
MIRSRERKIFIRNPGREAARKKYIFPGCLSPWIPDEKIFETGEDSEC